MVRLGLGMFCMSVLMVWGGTCLRQAQQTAQLSSCLRLGLQFDCAAPATSDLTLGDPGGAIGSEIVLDALSCRQRRQRFIERCGEMYGD